MKSAPINYQINYKLLAKIMPGISIKKMCGRSSSWINSKLRLFSAKEERHAQLITSLEPGQQFMINLSKSNSIMVSDF